MPAEYPPEHDLPNSGSDEEDEEDDEEDEEEEQIEEWTELTPLNELAELEDGPSSHFVGGFSVCHHLGDAISRVQFKEDVVLVFPGVYAAASASSPSSSSPLELNEALLGGLCVYSVPYAREHALHGGMKTTEPRYAAPSKRRVGPWFTYLTAAATAVFLMQAGDSGDIESETANKGCNPLQAAAKMAAAAVDSQAAATTSTMSTTSGSSVFAPVITATTVNPQLYPVFDFSISIVYKDEAAGAAASPTYGLRHYVQQLDSDEEDDEGEVINEAGDGDDEDEAEQEGAGAPASREEVAITLAGLCVRAGVSIGSITRAHITHCVIGSPQQYSTSSEAGAAAPRITVTAEPLAEALVDYCLVYGGSAYGLYAYPRCALTMRSCIVEGPNAAAAAYNAAGASSISARSAGCSRGGSAIEQLQRRQARTQWLRDYMARVEESQEENTSDGGRGGASFDVEEGVLPRFCVPGTKTAAAAAIPISCEVGIMCDDADLNLTDCLVTHTRHGVLLHGGCAGTVVKGLSVRSIAEVGLYLYGMAGTADIQYSSVCACGQECLLVVGPSAAEVAAAEAALPTRPSDEDEVDDEEASSDHEQRRPIFAQHPYIHSNCFIGAARVQGEVRSGAMMDNLVFLSREERSVATAAAVAAQKLLAVTSDTARGFAYAGVEGERAPTRAADEAVTA
ncbi:hypothetical protein LSCM4_05101 [Leishmania orientalis]|uniref:Uncharacterized protein n=1 Tax=Leishmania orientalis TaxID=2249476 RepID=A0A836G6I4_9TRYP|nr:hypothetical protein LSCM4_05101 [Leishmania orientalis]